MEAIAEKTKVDIAEENGEVWWDTDLDEEEQWYEDHFDEFVPCENQEELRRRLMEAAHNTMEEVRAKEAAKAKKSPVTINLDGGAVAYFKQLAEETGISYQNLINLFLVQCAKEKKRPVFA